MIVSWCCQDTEGDDKKIAAPASEERLVDVDADMSDASSTGLGPGGESGEDNKPSTHSDDESGSDEDGSRSPMAKIHTVKVSCEACHIELCHAGVHYRYTIVHLVMYSLMDAVILLSSCPLLLASIRYPSHAIHSQCYTQLPWRSVLMRRVERP